MSSLFLSFGEQPVSAQTTGCSDESVSFDQLIKLDLAGSSSAFSEDLATQIFLADTIADVFNELSNCQEADKAYKNIDAGSPSEHGL